MTPIEQLIQELNELKEQHKNSDVGVGIEIALLKAYQKLPNEVKYLQDLQIKKILEN